MRDIAYNRLAPVESSAKLGGPLRHRMWRFDPYFSVFFRGFLLNLPRKTILCSFLDCDKHDKHSEMLLDKRTTFCSPCIQSMSP